MKFIALLIIFSCLCRISYCQKGDHSFTIQPNSTHLIDSIERDKILGSLEGFLDSHLKGIRVNPFIDSLYLTQTPQPFRWFRIDTSVYKPTLLSILPIIDDKQFLITLSYVGTTFDKKVLHGLTYSMVIKRASEKYFFYNAIDFHTRNWNRKQVGTVNYIYPNTLDIKRAKEFDAFNKSLAKKFEKEVIPITYYKCDDPIQLFRIMGCDFIPNMYLSTYGGLAEENNTLFAGNNSEWYPHEIVHFYINQFPSYNRIVHEGYATFIGGSGGYSIKELKEIAKQFLKGNPNANLTNMFLNFERITKGIPFTYIASGLICQRIEKERGFSSIRKLFESKEDDESYFTQLEKVTGVDKSNFAKYLAALISD